MKLLIAGLVVVLFWLIIADNFFGALFFVVLGGLLGASLAVYYFEEKLKCSITRP